MADPLQAHVGKPIMLPGSATYPERAHVFAEADLDAITFALAANRPLLVRGEPGTGKTQLAEAAAKILKRPLLIHAVDGRTEPRDLLFEIDYVQRLAEAQLRGAVPNAKPDVVAKELGLLNFTRPGPLWWGLNWESADKTGSCSAPDTNALQDWSIGDGCVVLIDEIDKAEPDVPNGLLEVLGSGRFRGPLGDTIVAAGRSPLIVITTNEERELPDAFVRRCLVHRLDVPEGEAEFVNKCTERGRAHFAKCSDRVLMETAKYLFDDRTARSGSGPRPGLAEYLDAVRVLQAETRSDAEQLALLERLRTFVFQKSGSAR